jgi:hypothetical protein
MPIASGLAEQFEPGELFELSLDTAIPDAPPSAPDPFGALREAIARLSARVAELETPRERWLALKLAAANCNVQYETARHWCARGLIAAHKAPGCRRWLVDENSLITHLSRVRA